MRLLILACGMLFTVSTFAEEQVNAPDRAELHDVVLSYFVIQHELGGQHPVTIRMRKELESRLNAGERFISSKLDAELSDLYREHRLLTEKRSMRHPETRANLHRLSIAAKLMTYDPDYFAKNWEQLIARSRP